MKAMNFIFALLLVPATGVQAQGMSMPMNPPASASPRSSLPAVDAEVRKVNDKNGLILLKHADIPNLGMGPMTMEFVVADKKMLKDLKAGHKVKFRADMVAGKATVTELRRVR